MNRGDGSRRDSAFAGVGRGEAGYVLVSLLWLLGILAVVLTAMSVFTVNSLSVVASSNDRAGVEALTRGGIEAAIPDILATPPKRAVRGRVTARTATGVVEANWVGESGRVDLNQAPPAVIQSLLAGLAGDDDDEAARVARLILARRPAPPGSPAPASPPGPLRHLGELILDGASEQIVARMAPYVTVYGTGKIDPRLAPRAVLEFLPDMSEARFRGLMALRAAQSSDKEAWDREAGSAATLLTLDPPRTIRLRVNAKLERGAVGAAEAVIVVFPDDAEPYRVLAWDDHPARQALDELGEDSP